MIKNIKFLFACAIIFSGVAFAAFGFPSALLMGKVSSSPPPTSVCSSPTPPHPASVAGFTTLAYCADFTQETSANNYTTTGGLTTMTWSNTLNWLQCFDRGTNPSNPQWQVSSGGVGTAAPCGNITVGADPAFPTVNALNSKISAGAADQVIFIESGTAGCNFGCYESFPTTNMYVEIKYRIDSSAYASMVVGSPSNVLKWDLFSLPVQGTADNGNVEADFIEIGCCAAPSSQFYTNGFTTNAGGSPFGNNNGTFGPSVNDSNYHVMGSLQTANSGVANIGMCTYFDGTGYKCNGINPTTTGSYKQQGFLILWNTSGHPTAAPVDMNGWIAYVRVWSCAGWSSTGNQPPAASSTTNSCVSSTVYNSGAPP